MALVVSVGEGTRFQSGVINPVRVESGQRILIDKNAGLPLSVNTEVLHLVREAEILGVFEEEEKHKLEAVG